MWETTADALFSTGKSYYGLVRVSSFVLSRCYLMDWNAVMFISALVLTAPIHRWDIFPNLMFLSALVLTAPIHCWDISPNLMFLSALVLTAPIHRWDISPNLMFLISSRSDGTHSLLRHFSKPDVFNQLSFWRHPFTAETFLQTWRRNTLILIWDEHIVDFWWTNASNFVIYV